MAKTRQVRISDQRVIQSTINKYIGKQISIVRQDNRVSMGTLRDVRDGSITLVNARQKPQPIELSKIAELYLDTHTLAL